MQFSVDIELISPHPAVDMLKVLSYIVQQFGKPFASTMRLRLREKAWCAPTIPHAATLDESDPRLQEPNY